MLQPADEEEIVSVFSFLVMVHVVICILLILAILLQSGKGGGLSSAFGGGGAGGGMAGQMFGGRGAGTFLSKATSIVAALYMIMVIGLNLVPNESQGPASLIREEALKQQEASPGQGLPVIPSEGQPAGVDQPQDESTEEDADESQPE